MCWKFQGTKPNLERGARVYWTYYYLKTASWASLAKRFGKTAAYLNQLAFHWAQKNNKPWPPVDADDQRVKYYKTSYREICLKSWKALQAPTISLMILSRSPPQQKRWIGQVNERRSKFDFVFGDSRKAPPKRAPPRNL